MTKLKIGDIAPAFSLKDQNGQLHKLSYYKGKKVVLYFYPKDMTPGCTIEACDFTGMKKQFDKKDVVIFGVSNDSEELHKKFEEKHTLSFPLLADIDKKVSNDYGVYGEKSFMGNFFKGIHRTTFVIDEKGKIAKIYENVKAIGHAKQVLEES